MFRAFCEAYFCVSGTQIMIKIKLIWTCIGSESKSSFPAKINMFTAQHKIVCVSLQL